MVISRGRIDTDHGVFLDAEDILRFHRLRLHGPNGANGSNGLHGRTGAAVHSHPILAGPAQNLRKLAN